MTTQETVTLMSANEVRIRLQKLQVERAIARCAGLASNRTYMTDLEHEIATVSCAYVGAAVTEIAVLRGQLSGPQNG
jgi:hypothetical protein